MKTKRNYAGKRKSARSSEQTAKNAVQTHSNVQKHLEHLRQKHWKTWTVEGVVATYFDANSAVGSVHAITEMLHSWLTETDNETGILINDLRTLDAANTLSSTLRLINLIGEIGEKNLGLNKQNASNM